MKFFRIVKRKFDNKKNNEENKNKKKGVTFFVLVITIIFILIITSGLSISFFNVIDSTNKKEFANEINSIQKLVDQYDFMNNKYPITDNIYTFNLSTLSIDEKIQFSLEEGYEDNQVMFYEINLYEAGVDEIARGVRRNGNELDIYVLSENTGKVYYLKGEEYDGVRYYTLTEELKNSLGI